MNQLKYSLALTILLFLTSNLLGAAESFMVHIDKPFYVVGEKISFKLYYPEVKEKAVVRILLVNDKNDIVQDFYGKSENTSYLASCVSIPFNYSTGTYRLVFNSNVSGDGLDEELTLAEIAFPIYNDLSTQSLEIGSFPTMDSILQYEVDQKLKLNIQTGKVQYGTRDQVSVTVNITDDQDGVSSNASVSIAVIPKSIEETTNDGLQYVSKGPAFTSNISPFISGDVYVKGKVYNRGGRAVRLNVIGAYADQYKAIRYTKSNSDGAFTLKYPDLYGQQDLQFLPYEEEISRFNIELDEPARSNQVFSSVYFKEGLADLLQLTSLQKKLDQYFKIEPSYTLSGSAVGTSTSLKSDITFEVNEYEKFDLLYDFFSELITPLTFKKVKGEMIASMNNPKSTRAVATNLPGNPLFIIDGKLTRNADFAGNLKMSNIETIELIYSPAVLRERFNVMGRSGVVMVNTITPLFEFPEADSDDLFVINGLQGSCDFESFNPSDYDEHLPYFKSTIYWNPDLKTDASGNVSASFNHTDNTGDFSIIVVSQDEKGKRGVAVYDYQVGVEE